MMKDSSKPGFVHDTACHIVCTISKSQPLRFAHAQIRCDSTGMFRANRITIRVVTQNNHVLASAHGREQFGSPHSVVGAFLMAVCIVQEYTHPRSQLIQLREPSSCVRKAGSVGIKPQSPNSVPA